jgi:hypothetical protein
VPYEVHVTDHGERQEHLTVSDLHVSKAFTALFTGRRD